MTASRSRATSSFACVQGAARRAVKEADLSGTDVDATVNARVDVIANVKVNVYVTSCNAIDCNVT